jgi:hypothetical protein
MKIDKKNEGFIDFFETIKISDTELIELAYQRYFDDLNTNFLYIFKFNKNDKSEWIKNINEAFLNNMPEVFGDVDNNNPANYSHLTCYKLLLCSSKKSPWWSIHYSNLYKYFYASQKANSKINVDIFLGKIEALFKKVDDTQFTTFERLVNLKYNEINLNQI